DNGLLNIMVVDGDKEELDVIHSVIGEKGYAVSSCTYSYAELIKMIDRVGESIPAIMDAGVLISSVGEDVKNNCVVIGVEGCTKEDENKVRAIVDAPYITFADEERAEKKSTSIKGGYGIVSSNNGGCSKVGFCAENSSNVEGFIIAGHAGDLMYENFTYNGTTVGYVTATAY
nr:S1 family peptidase [Lachnospiraceae bacterium]